MLAGLGRFGTARAAGDAGFEFVWAGEPGFELDPMVELDLDNAVMVGIAANVLMLDAALALEAEESGLGFVGLLLVAVLSIVTFRLESFCLF